MVGYLRREDVEPALAEQTSRMPPPALSDVLSRVRDNLDAHHHLLQEQH